MPVRPESLDCGETPIPSLRPPRERRREPPAGTFTRIERHTSERDRSQIHRSSFRSRCERIQRRPCPVERVRQQMPPMGLVEYRRERERLHLGSTAPVCLPMVRLETRHACASWELNCQPLPSPTWRSDFTTLARAALRSEDGGRHEPGHARVRLPGTQDRVERP